HHIARRGIDHRIIGSNETIRQIMASHREEFGKSFVHPNANCSVAGVDTINARSEDKEIQKWALQLDQWAIDEAHHVLRANKWGRAVALFKNARGFGVTATAGRPDGQGLGAEFDGVFHSIAFGPEMRWLINN